MLLFYLEVSCLENNNKYVVKNSFDQKIFSTVEDSGCCNRFWCSNTRSLELKIIDNFGNEVIHRNRPLACACCLYPCCLQVSQLIKFLELLSLVANANGPEFQRESTTLVFNAIFHILLSQIIKYRISSFTNKVSPITFPMELDVKMKAVLLSACFLIVRFNQFILINSKIHQFWSFQDFLYCESDRESVGDDGYEANDLLNDNSA
jgi:hypothetical protein